MDWYLKAVKSYAVFSGRSGRREFWMFQLWNMAFILAAVILDRAFRIDSVDLTKANLSGLTIGPITITYLVAMIIPNLALQCRRLHDVRRTGWFQLVALIPLVGAFILLFLCTLPGTMGPNRYGPRPDAGLETDR